MGCDDIGWRWGGDGCGGRTLGGGVLGRSVSGGSVSGGSLFKINENTLLRLTDCTVTVSNPNLRNSVYAFDVIADSSFSGGATAGEPEVQIELNNVVVRGEITMLHMDEAAKLGLDWDNGLLAVSGSMIETGGTQTKSVFGMASEKWKQSRSERAI